MLAWYEHWAQLALPAVCRQRRGARRGCARLRRGRRAPSLSAGERPVGGRGVMRRAAQLWCRKPPLQPPAHPNSPLAASTTTTAHSTGGGGVAAAAATARAAVSRRRAKTTPKTTNPTPPPGRRPQRRRGKRCSMTRMRCARAGPPPDPEVPPDLCGTCTRRQGVGGGNKKRRLPSRICRRAPRGISARHSDVVTLIEVGARTSKYQT